jgi:hypothetical protein
MGLVDGVRTGESDDGGLWIEPGPGLLTAEGRRMAEGELPRRKLPDAAPDLVSLVEGMIRRQSESRSLDYKAPTSFGPGKAEKGEFVKDLIAFANARDGGSILVGVDLRDGLYRPTGVTSEQAASFDTTDIGDFARRYCSVLPQYSVHLVDVDGATIVLVRVGEFSAQPIVCTRDLHESKGRTLVLRAGSVYVRTSDAKSAPIMSAEEMQGLLDVAIQKRGDGLLQQIRELAGSPAVAPAPSEPPEQFMAEVSGSEELFDNEDLTGGFWQVAIFPAVYDENRIAAFNRLREIRRESVVSIRGWDFPHVDRVQDLRFEDGLQSVTHGSRYHEAHRMYRSGLFVWRRRFGEDYVEQFKGVLSYVSTIYSFTEWFIFASRYASLVVDGGDVFVRIGADGLSGRRLVADPGSSVILSEGYETAAKQFRLSQRLPLAELRGAHVELARDVLRPFFELFGADIAADVIGEWQEKFIDQRI